VRTESLQNLDCDVDYVLLTNAASLKQGKPSLHEKHQHTHDQEVEDVHRSRVDEARIGFLFVTKPFQKKKTKQNKNKNKNEG